MIFSSKTTLGFPNNTISTDTPFTGTVTSVASENKASSIAVSLMLLFLSNPSDTFAVSVIAEKLPTKLEPL